MTFQSRKLFETLAPTLVPFLLAPLACTAGQIGDPIGPDGEIMSPTGCLKSQGRYYDPRIGQCVEVKTKHQALVLNAYRYVNELADQDVGDVDYAIYPRTYLTITDADTLWSELREIGATPHAVGGRLPDDRVYDPESEVELLWQTEHNGTARSWGVKGSAFNVGWSMPGHPNASPQPKTIHDMLLSALDLLDQDRPRPQLREAVLGAGDCRIDFIAFRADAKKVRDWTDQRWDDIEGIQPLVTFLDQNLPSLGPITVQEEGK